MIFLIIAVIAWVAAYFAWFAFEVRNAKHEDSEIRRHG
jgi:hypothetical protein